MSVQRTLALFIGAATVVIGTGAAFPDHLSHGSRDALVFSIEPTDGVLCSRGAELRDGYGKPWPQTLNGDEVLISIVDHPRIWFANGCEGNVLVSGPLGVDAFMFSGDGELVEPISPGLAIVGGLNLRTPLFIQMVAAPLGD